MGTNCTRSIAIASLSLVLTTACSGRPPFAPEGHDAPSPAPAGSSLAGAYELTFAASPNCNPDWWEPGFVPSRTYQATLSEASAYIYLTGATFAPTGFANPDYANAIYLGSLGDVVTLYFEDPPIVESSPRHLVIYGHASGPMTDPLTELTVDGDFFGCDAPNHKLTMRRISLIGRES